MFLTFSISFGQVSNRITNYFNKNQYINYSQIQKDRHQFNLSDVFIIRDLQTKLQYRALYYLY
ncbi:hypothetical protein pb186bvf_002086 [Paramecium bursaria]